MVTLVSNMHMRYPESPKIRLVIVESGLMRLTTG
jgi:uncharacterized protein YaiI (UPF0178 family)